MSSSEQIQLAALQVASSIVDRIKKHQQDDPELVKLVKKVEEDLPQITLQRMECCGLPSLCTQ